MRSVESLLENMGKGRGSTWSSLDLETLGSDVSSGKSAGAIAKDRGWPSSSVRLRVAALKRGDLAPRRVGGAARRLTPGLLDDIREFIEEEHGRISGTIVSNRFALSRTSSRKAVCCLHLHPLVIRTVLHRENRHIRDRRKFVEEMLARLALASRGRSQRVDGRTWTLLASAMIKSTELTLWLQVTGFTHLLRENKGDVYNATPLSGYSMRKRVREAPIATSAHILRHFS